MAQELTRGKLPGIISALPVGSEHGILVLHNHPFYLLSSIKVIFSLLFATLSHHVNQMPGAIVDASPVKQSLCPGDFISEMHLKSIHPLLSRPTITTQSSACAGTIAF